VQKIACPRCNETLYIADICAPTRCRSCGCTIGPLAVPSQAIAAGDQPEYIPARPPRDLERPEEPYSNWDDFRLNSPAVQSERIKLATSALPDMRSLKLLPVPESAPDTDQELGSPLAALTLDDESESPDTFRVRPLHCAGALAAVVMLVVFLEVNAHHSAAIGVSVTFAVALFGLWYGHRSGLLRGTPLDVNLGRPFLSTRLWLFEEGILWQSGADFGKCRFEDMEDFRVNLESAQPRFRIAPRGQDAIVMSLNCSVEIMPMAEYMEVKMASAQLLPKLRRIVAGERVRFGAVVLDARGFASPGFAAAWSDIVRVMADRKQLFVDRRGQPEWHEIAYRQVAFPRVVLALSAVLIEEAKRLPPADASLIPIDGSQ